MASFGVSAVDANAAGSAAAAPSSPLTVAGQVAGGAVKPSASLTALTVVGIAGNFSAVLVLTMPMYFFVKPVVETKSVGTSKPYGFLMMLTNCIFWILFALPALKHSVFVVSVNGVGVVVQVVYIGVYLWYASVPARRMTFKLLLGVLAISTLLAGLVIWFVIVKKVWSIKFMGVIASSFTTLMFIIGLIVDVIELEQGRIGQSLMQMAWNVTNAAIWTVFGFLSAPANAFVVVPNVFGMACTMVGFIARLIYCMLPTNRDAGSA